MFLAITFFKLLPHLPGASELSYHRPCLICQVQPSLWAFIRLPGQLPSHRMGCSKNGGKGDGEGQVIYWYYFYKYDVISRYLTHHGPVPHICVAIFSAYFPSARDMGRWLQCSFPQCPIHGAWQTARSSPVPQIVVARPHLLSHQRPIYVARHGPPILTRVVWKILNVVTNILVVLPDYRLP